jgi:predicted DCC family thiol-disulfide oxidoreductase YuxK
VPIQDSRVSNPPEQPILVIDGDCPFCLRWARRLKRLSGIGYAAYQHEAWRYAEISRQEFERSVQFIDTVGRVYSGAAAVFRMMDKKRGLGWLFWLYRHCSAFAGMTERIYNVVSRNRHKL